MAKSSEIFENSRASKIVISVDAMGGDNGATAVMEGIYRASKSNEKLFFLIHGDKKILSQEIDKRPTLKLITKIVPTTKIVAMNEKPSSALRNAQDTSMSSALISVKKGEANIALSCGNTGALMAMAMVNLRKVPGVNRPAIAVLWPSRNIQGFNIVLDAGADIKADPTDLLQYALMGTAYAEAGFGLRTPRIGLLNVGTEIHKGRNELREASELIKKAENSGKFNYIGFVEGIDLPSNAVDVVVTDGFTGNVALKTGEGTASLINDFLKEAFNKSFFSKLGGVLAQTALRNLKKRIDPRHVNGGVFLGLNGTVVKSHGGADAIAVAAAINLSFQLENSGFSKTLASKFRILVDNDL